MYDEFLFPPPSMVPMTLRRAHNATVPIAKLHHEILAEVFIFSASHVPVIRPSYAVTPPLHWLHVTHVCHSWREAALNSPRVWSYLRRAKDIECLQEMLARSKQAPLFVDFAYRYYDSRAAKVQFELIYPHLDRVRTLSIAAGDTTRLPDTLPRLTELSLYNYGHPRIDLRGHIPTVLESCSIPQLSCLRLFWYDMHWSNPIFRQGSLTRLSVHCTKREDMQHLGSEDLLDVLRGCPLLQELDLKHAIGTNSLEDRTTADVVPLSYLHTLSLGDATASCTKFLRRITFPGVSNLSLECDALDGESAEALGEELAHTIDVKDVKTNSDDWPNTITLSIKQFPRAMYIQCWAAELNMDVLAHAFPGYVTDGRAPFFVVTLRGDRSLTLPSFHAFCRPLSLSSVRVLYVETSDIGLVISHLLAIADGMSNVQTLGFSHSNPTYGSIELLDLLSVDSTDTPTPGLTRFIFPCLSALHLFDVEFHPSPKSEGTSQVAMKYSTVFSVRSPKIRQVQLHRPINVFEGDVDKLKSSVEEVVWNPDEVRYVTPFSDRY